MQPEKDTPKGAPIDWNQSVPWAIDLLGMVMNFGNLGHDPGPPEEFWP